MGKYSSVLGVGVFLVHSFAFAQASPHLKCAVSYTTAEEKNVGFDGGPSFNVELNDSGAATGYAGDGFVQLIGRVDSSGRGQLSVQIINGPLLSVSGGNLSQSRLNLVSQIDLAPVRKVQADCIVE